METTAVEQSICNLLAKWRRESVEINAKSKERKNAIDKCIFDLQGLLISIQEEDDYIRYFFTELPSKEAEDYLLGQEADDQLSTLEAHDTNI